MEAVLLLVSRTIWRTFKLKNFIELYLMANNSEPTYEGTKVETGKSFKKLKIVDAVREINRAMMRADQAKLLFRESTQNNIIGDKI